MLIWIWPRNDESGQLDDEFKDGDVWQAKPDSFEPFIGNLEKKAWLIVKIPNPPLIDKFVREMERSEYAPGPTPDSPSVVRRKRLFYVDWRSKFTAEEIAIIRNANQVLLDGPNVVNGIVIGKFSLGDISRK